MTEISRKSSGKKSTEERVIERPIALVLSRPHFGEGYREFLAYHGERWITYFEEREVTPAERLVEFAGRVCYMSFSRPAPRSNAEYIANLIRQGHESVLEHATWTFVLSGISRAFTHQLVRHRPGFAYSQLSQQYHSEADAKFVAPPGIRENPAAWAIWREAMEKTLDAYRSLIQLLGNGRGEAIDVGSRDREKRRALRSAARSVLPNATATVIVVTANARAIRHFLKVRGQIEGDAEMREVCAALLQAVGPDAPAIFGDFVVEKLADDTPIVRHQPKG